MDLCDADVVARETGEATAKLLHPLSPLISVSSHLLPSESRPLMFLGNQLAEDDGVGGAAWLKAAWVDLESHPAFETNTNQMLIDVICKWSPAFWQY